RKSDITNLIVTNRGNHSDGREQGTWLHEDIAIEFARWLSPSFAIWCNDRIKDLQSFHFENFCLYLLHEHYRKASNTVLCGQIPGSKKCVAGMVWRVSEAGFR